MYLQYSGVPLREFLLGFLAMTLPLFKLASACNNLYNNSCAEPPGISSSSCCNAIGTLLHKMDSIVSSVASHKPCIDFLSWHLINLVQTQTGYRIVGKFGGGKVWQI